MLVGGVRELSYYAATVGNKRVAVSSVQDSGVEGDEKRQRSRSRAPPSRRVACYFKHDVDDAQPARQRKKKHGGGKKCGKRRRVRLGWARTGCHFRT